MAAHYSKDDANGIEVTLAMFDRTRHYERDDHDLTFVALCRPRTSYTAHHYARIYRSFEDEISSLNLKNRIHAQYERERTTTYGILWQIFLTLHELKKTH